MIGTIVCGRYRILEKLGEGGQGVVYKAYDERLDCTVAIKALPEEMLADLDALKQLDKEARTLAKLNHPNIASVRDFLTQEGVGFLVMELISGETLDKRFSQGAIPEKDVARLGVQISKALEEAHEVGILHCDLKPRNIMVTPKDHVKVLDFGLAKHLRPVSANSRTETASESGVLAGTHAYMAPEQLMGAKPDRRSDLYSFGVILYEMCTGKHPFDEKTGPRLTEAILHRAPLVPSASNPRVSPALDGIVLKALEKEPEHRYQSARELSVDLERLFSRGSLLTVIQPRRSRRASMLRVALAMIVLAGLLASRPWVWLRRHLPTGFAPRIESVVILPLLNATGDPEVDYLSSGISESIINSLSQLRSVRVLARNTAFSYAAVHKSTGFDPRKIGEDLGVSAAVMGEVTQRRRNLAIQADLVETAHGSQLWGGRYDRGSPDVLAVSQEIVERICENLGFELTAQESTQVAKRYTESSQAYQLYLKGRYYSNQYTVESLKKGIQTLGQAVEMDPSYALAYAGLAACYYDASGLYLVPSDAMLKAEVAARHALELDPELAEAHTALAQVDAQYKWEWEAAEKGYLKALDLKPGYAPAHQMFGIMLAEQGRLVEALAQLTEARKLDPLTPYVSANLAWVEYLARRYDQAILENQRILQAHPDFHVAHYNLGQIFVQQRKYVQAIAEFEAAWRLDPENAFPPAMLGYAYAVSGDPEQAREILNQLQEMSERLTVSPFYYALVHVGLGEKDKAFSWFDRAADFRSEELLNLKVDPKFDGLHTDPRFERLLRRMNLAP